MPDLLANAAGVAAGDYALHLNNIPPFGWPSRDADHLQHRVLLLAEEADLPSGQRSILVCGYCGAAGCGVISAIIERDGETIIWRDFGIELDWNVSELGWENPDLSHFRSVGPFRFALVQYEWLLTEMCEGQVAP